MVLFPVLLTAEEESQPAPLTEDERAAIIKKFTASEAGFSEDGSLELVYDFETENLALTQDWLPETSKTKRRVRWAQGYEGTFDTVEHGIVIADKGTWYHRARFLPEGISIDVDYMSMSTCRPGDLLAAVFFYDKGRRSVGSNAGQQCIRLKGARHSGAPMPRDPAVVSSEQRFRFGTSIEEGGVVTCRSASGKGRDTSEDENFAKKLDSGSPGILWNGLINGFVFKITIKGQLDPDWVRQQLKAENKHITAGRR